MRHENYRLAALNIGLTQIIRYALRRHLPSATVLETVDTPKASTITIEALGNKFEISVKYLDANTDKTLNTKGENNETETN